MEWIITKSILLLIAIMFTFSNIVKAFRGNSISGFQIFLMAASIVGFVTIQFWLGF